ncbi:ArgP/LysG family DNA-binding transcriptional regulator [Asaia sp. W19]|uniref:LysR family transcriptional regulator ArgP n=1 Tax=unclassified Asaia TaxID=2685023 RepID=UPI000F8E19D0|nr:LysR family transcriptional regulator ArgP [Asaia sp. W19]RUT25701.1 ArgP/LysG family DNA-binding transcriptional regulator [Asaia sp. W19]RUT25860.1 ArgP/LysG family DNA-binding transcriptional regulator [Asaia sp. W19]
MLDYPSLAAVAAVIREGTFERAAAVLGHTPSAVSQRVRGLEERLGAILIQRGQPCQPTALGRKLCDHVDRVRLLEQDLGPALGHGGGSLSGGVATIAIAVNADSMATWFAKAAADFTHQTTVALDFRLDDEAHTADRLRSGEVLAAVSSNPAPIPGCKIIELGTLRYAACASPAFMAHHFSQEFSIERLAAAPSLRFDRRDGLQARWLRETHGTEPGKVIHWVPSTQGFLDLGLAGVGWGMHPIKLVREHLTAGRLVELPPGIRIGVALYWTVARLHADTLIRLTQAVQRAAATELQAHDG